MNEIASLDVRSLSEFEAAYLCYVGRVLRPDICRIRSL